MKKTASLYWGEIKDIKDDVAIIKERIITLSKNYGLYYQEVENDVNKELDGLLFIRETD